MKVWAILKAISRVRTDLSEPEAFTQDAQYLALPTPYFVVPNFGNNNNYPIFSLRPHFFFSSNMKYIFVIIIILLLYRFLLYSLKNAQMFLEHYSVIQN